MYKLPLLIILVTCLLACKSNETSAHKSNKTAKLPFDPEKYLCVQSPVQINIDGVLNDPAWELAAWSNKFVDIEGDVKPEPHFDTRVKMLWDSSYLYIAAEIIEPQIWASITKHDSIIYLDDAFEVFIDPDGDTHNYYEYQINALGADWDLLLTKPYRDGGQGVNSWEIPGLKKGIKIYGSINNPSDEDEKWTVELAFPWDVLREYNTSQKMPEKGDQWRINFARVDWIMAVENNNGHPMQAKFWVWSPQGIVAMHQPETWGYVQFVANASGKFIDNADEHIKWALREVYYRQHAYFNKHKKFTDDFGELQLSEIQLYSLDFQPKIQLVPGGFIASYPAKNQEGTWYIQTDGLVKLAHSIE